MISVKSNLIGWDTGLGCQVEESVSLGMHMGYPASMTGPVIDQTTACLQRRFLDDNRLGLYARNS
jgi:hypothetical protein